MSTYNRQGGEAKLENENYFLKSAPGWNIKHANVSSFLFSCCSIKKVFPNSEKANIAESSLPGSCLLSLLLTRC